MRSRPDGSHTLIYLPRPLQLLHNTYPSIPLEVKTKPAGDASSSSSFPPAVRLCTGRYLLPHLVNCDTFCEPWRHGPFAIVRVRVFILTTSLFRRQLLPGCLCDLCSSILLLGLNSASVTDRLTSQIRRACGRPALLRDLGWRRPGPIALRCIVVQALHHGNVTQTIRLLHHAADPGPPKRPGSSH